MDNRVWEFAKWKTLRLNAQGEWNKGLMVKSQRMKVTFDLKLLTFNKESKAMRTQQH
jgi:hypothetical protein